MEYFRVLDSVFVARNDKTIWLTTPGSKTLESRMQRLDIKDNAEIDTTITNSGIKIKDRIFEMNIPKVMTGQQHLNVAFYLGSLDNKERKI